MSFRFGDDSRDRAPAGDALAIVVTLIDGVIMEFDQLGKKLRCGIQKSLTRYRAIHALLKAPEG